MSTPAILLAEDEETDAILMMRAFRIAGMSARLIRVRDGDEVVDYLSGDGIFANREEYPIPFLLLLDLKMPRRDGFEVLAWIRTQPRLKRLMVTVLTSSDEQKDIKKAYEFGASSYLRKPTDFNDLVQVVQVLQSYLKIVEPPSCR